METLRRPFSIKIFLVEGSPSGVKFLEKSNWTGLGVVCPRPRLTMIKSRKEFARAGVYVLVGPSDSSGIPFVYIGEGDPIKPRLEDHHANKDFWTVAYFFTTKDQSLNKAHIEYLEHRLISLADDAKRCNLDNNLIPSPPSLSEAEFSDVESFLDEMLLCFPVLGVTIFEKPELQTSNRAILTLSNKGIKAEGYESEDGFVVRRGSTAVSDYVPSIPTNAKEMRKLLIDNGILEKQANGFYCLKQDYEFSSPSTAAAVLVAASINGRDWWKTIDGLSLKELQEASSSKNP